MSKTFYTDTEIVQGLLYEADIESIYEYFLERSFPSIKKLVVSWGGNSDDAYDLFTETFLAMYENIRQGSYEERGSVNTYFFGIAKNIWFKMRKKNKREEEVVQNIYHSYMITDESFTTNEDFRQKYKVIEKIIETLPPNSAEILNLYYFQGLTHKQIAKKLKYKNADTVKTMKSRCLKKILEEFAKQHKAK